MSKKFSSVTEAAKHLQGSITEILNSGFTITGLNLNEVVIHAKPPETPGVTMTPPEPSGPPPSSTPRGYDGDVSSCCGAPAERKGTCLYCTNCGGSNGCS